MRWWLFTVCGILAYLFFLISNVPVQYAIHLLTSSGLPLAIEQSNGSIWHGGANQISYAGTTLGPVKWRFTPLGLLSGQIRYAIELNNSEYTVAGYIARAIFTDGLTLSEIKGQLPADRLLEFSDLDNVVANGQLELDLQTLLISQRRIRSAQGEIRWLDASIQQPIRAELGNLQFTLSEENNGLKSGIEDIDGPLQVDGEFFLQADGNYRLQGKVKPTNSANQGLVSLLQSIGRPISGGSIQIDYYGQL
jgi:hypothetical protein